MLSCADQAFFPVSCQVLQWVPFHRFLFVQQDICRFSSACIKFDMDFKVLNSESGLRVSTKKNFLRKPYGTCKRHFLVVVLVTEGSMSGPPCCRTVLFGLEVNSLCDGIRRWGQPACSML